eukprot:COSAG02_NODE_1933_length_10319_cov_22.624168_5_plen_647_part_00
MPVNNLDGFIRNPSIGIADVPTTGERSRRLSCAADLSFSLPGVTGSLMAADPSASAGGDGAAGEKPEANEDGPEYQFPWWWFVILTLPGFLHSLVSNALWGIIWPNLLSQMSGDRYKFLALAAGSQICTVVGYAHPFIGSMSDRLPDKYAKYIGRRRPFIIIGSFIMSFGVWMTYDALYRIVDRPAHCTGHDPAWEQLHTYGRCKAAGGSWQAYPVSHSHLVWAYIELAASLVVGNAGSAVFSPPFTAIVADTIPLSQRGLCVVIQSWTNTVTGLGSGAIAYMTSEQLACDLGAPPQDFPIESEQWDGACFSAKTIWWCDIWILILQMPLYCICCNGQAIDGCSWSGIWKPEKSIKRPVETLPSANVDGSSLTRCQRWKHDFWAFTAAFRDPCYKWLWIQGFIGQIGSMIGGQFNLYWYQDCFNQCTGCKGMAPDELVLQVSCTVVKDVTECNPHFFFFGWEVASTGAGAVAINTLVSQVLHIVIMPFIRPDYWRDRFGGRPLLIWTGFWGLGLTQPFAYAWLTGTQHLYTIIQLWTVWGCFLSCIGTAAAGALMMDCLPADAAGKPLSASRDLALHEWANRIPETGFPLLLGGSFLWFSSHQEAFRTFFCISGAIGFVTNAIFIFLVHPRDEVGARQTQSQISSP